MVRKTKEEAELTRQAVLHAGLKVFSRQGYAATRLEDIAEEAGVTRGAIYWHFKNKAELYNELQYHAAERLNGVVQSAAASAASTLDSLKRVMVSVWTHLEDDAEFRAIQELTLLKTELTPDLLAGMEEKLASMQKTNEQLIAAIQQGVADGEIDPALSPDMVASGYTAYLNGMALMYVLSQGEMPLKEHAEALAEIYMRGLRPR